MGLGYLNRLVGSRESDGWVLGSDGGSAQYGDISLWGHVLHKPFKIRFELTMTVSLLHGLIPNGTVGLHYGE